MTIVERTRSTTSHGTAPRDPSRPEATGTTEATSTDTTSTEATSASGQSSSTHHGRATTPTTPKGARSRAAAASPAEALSPAAVPTPVWGTRDTVVGAWRAGDPVGHRRFAAVGDVGLERGGYVPDVRVAFETWGELNAAGDNAILVEHALTGDSHVVGPVDAAHPSPGWWDGLVGPGRPLDTRTWFVVAPNVLGGCQGTTGPSSFAPDGSPWGSRFPFITIRDQVAVEERLADLLGVRSWAAVVGGSMGGMRVVEWAVTHPDRVQRAVVVASTAYATADQIAWAQPQLLAIRSDPQFRGGDYYDRTDPFAGPEQGMGIARRIAHVTYRSSQELDERFGRDVQGQEQPLGAGGRYAVESYLDHHAAKLGRRFDANSYLVLTEAMNSHDVGRGRGGVRAALQRVTAATTVVAVDSDRLYPARLSAEIAAAVPHTSGHTIPSEYGHDGFLIEIDQVGQLIRDAVA